MHTPTSPRSFPSRSTLFAALALALAAPLAAPLTQDASAQVTLGADVMSRYVWRGIDFGESLSVQPALEYSGSFAGGSFAVGTWASYAASPVGGDFNEHDLYASLTLGSLTLGLTDYYFPAGSASLDDGDFDFFDFEAAHVIEPSLGFSAGAFGFYAATVVFGDLDLDDGGEANFSTYLEASYSTSLAESGVDIALALGVVPMESAFYLTDGFALTNIALTAGKEVAITEGFALPLMVSYVLNPALERTYLVFGFSL
jgi:hypothetical protein